MFLKEVFSILSFSIAIFTISGFVIKVKKFEHNQLFLDRITQQLKLNLSFDSYSKLNLRPNSDFHYLVNEEEPRFHRINSVQRNQNNVEIILNNSRESRPKPQFELIKYYLESKPFWINIFS